MPPPLSPSVLSSWLLSCGLCALQFAINVTLVCISCPSSLATLCTICATSSSCCSRRVRWSFCSLLSHSTYKVHPGEEIFFGSWCGGEGLRVGAAGHGDRNMRWLVMLHGQEVELGCDFYSLSSSDPLPSRGPHLFHNSKTTSSRDQVLRIETQGELSPVSP